MYPGIVLSVAPPRGRGGGGGGGVSKVHAGVARSPAGVAPTRPSRRRGAARRVSLRRGMPSFRSLMKLLTHFCQNQ